MRPAAALNALPDFGFAGAFLLTWLAPRTLGDQAVTRLMLVMLLEFIIIHSSVFMGNVILSPAAKVPRSVGILVLGLFYSIFAGAFSLAFRTWWPFGTFWLQTGNRMLSVVTGQPDSNARALLKKSWVVSIMLYLGCCFVTVVPPVPALGITPAVVASLHLPGEGLWITEPQRVIAFGFLYFALTGWSELFDHRWLKLDQPVPT